MVQQEIRPVEVLTADLIEDALRVADPLVVDFFARWCTACHAIEPVLEHLSSRHRLVRFVRVDVGESPELVDRFGVRVLPTPVRFDGGQPTARAEGALPERALSRRLHLTAPRRARLKRCVHG